MFLDGVELAGGWLSAPGLIPDFIAGRELIRVGICPPLIECILTHEQLEQVPAVIIFGHFYLLPGDDHFISNARRHHVPWWTIHIASNGLQVKFLISNRRNISHDIYN